MERQQDKRYLVNCMTTLKTELSKNGNFTSEIESLFLKINNNLNGNTQCVSILIDTIKSLWDDIYVGTDFTDSLQKAVS